MDPIWRKQSIILPQKSDKEKSMTTTDKDEVEGSFNLKTYRHNIMYTLFYSNISEFYGNFQGMLDEGIHKTSIQTMNKICWKANYFNSDDVSILGSGCGASRFHQFYEKKKKKYQLLPHSYLDIYSVERVTIFFKKHEFFH